MVDKMNKKWLMEQGFSKKDAKTISDYDRAGRVSPAVRKSVKSVKYLFRTISWTAALVVIVYLIKQI